MSIILRVEKHEYHSKAPGCHDGLKFLKACFGVLETSL